MNRKRAVTFILAALLCGIFWTACGSEQEEPNQFFREEKAENEKAKNIEVEEMKETAQTSETVKETTEKETDNTATKQAVENEVDWSDYFDGLNGAAVIYEEEDNSYWIYNKELAQTRRSPCSTFKIVSSLVGMTSGVIVPEDSLRTWSGEVFWNEKWNKDIALQEAFSSSCVWYFKEVIVEIGAEVMQKELDLLQYGNCDISDWDGKLNTNNNNPALTGFWIESSLKISAREQIEVLRTIFGSESVYPAEAVSQLRDIMLVTDPKELSAPFYGKTGMGKMAGIVEDAWFVGFTQGKAGDIYFAVYLGHTDGRDVGSQIAKEIAIRIVTEQILNQS